MGVFPKTLLVTRPLRKVYLSKAVGFGLGDPRKDAEWATTRSGGAGRDNASFVPSGENAWLKEHAGKKSL